MSQVKIWQAPFRSLYSLSFYREVLESSLSTGMAYLAFLSFLAAILGGISFNRRAIPEVKELTQWAKAAMPPLALSSQGLQMKAASPYVMKHPVYGPLVVIDLAKTAIERKDFPERTLLILTAQRGFFYLRNQIRTFDYPLKGKEAEPPVPVTGEMIDRFSRMLLVVMLTGVPVVIFFFFFVWKFTAALVYSSFALLINRFRREPVPYDTLLNLSFFAMTAFTLIEFLSLFLPGFEIRGGFFTGLAVTLLYLAIGLLKTEPAPTE